MHCRAWRSTTCTTCRRAAQRWALRDAADMEHAGIGPCHAARSCGTLLKVRPDDVGRALCLRQGWHTLGSPWKRCRRGRAVNAGVIAGSVGSRACRCAAQGTVRCSTAGLALAKAGSRACRQAARGPWSTGEAHARIVDGHAAGPHLTARGSCRSCSRVQGLHACSIGRLKHWSWGGVQGLQQ